MDPEIRKLLTKPTCSVPDAGRAFGLGRNAAYEAASRGEIEVIEFGSGERKRKRVPTAWLRRKLGLAEAAA